MDQGQTTITAHADIEGEGIKGEAHFEEIENGTQRYVKIKIKLKGDPMKIIPGEHGVHIHEKGVCEVPFTSAGGHFDPGPAGNPDPDVNHPYHMGDLPNIVVEPDGSAEMEVISTRITLSEGPVCILTDEGTSIMIHGHHDAQMPGEHGSGISGGPRLACGVIKKVT